jgi:hypothetical protein
MTSWAPLASSCARERREVSFLSYWLNSSAGRYQPMYLYVVTRKDLLAA